MYTPYPENMMESIKKVEATREKRMSTEPRRLTADEKDALLKEFHPDYNPDAFAEIKVGPNKGQKAPLELAEMLHSTSRILNKDIDITKIDYAYEADTYFPNLDEMPEWELVADSEEQTYFDLEYYFLQYQKCVTKP